MGLSIEVGILADLEDCDPDSLEIYREQFETANQLLRQNGLIEHHEPTAIEVKSWDTGSYEGLYALRRVAAWVHLERQLPPPASKFEDDPIYERYQNFGRGFLDGQPSPTFDHLFYHSDSEGMYVPVDFADVLVADESLDLDGEILGSVQRLKHECDLLAEWLRISPTATPENPALVSAIEQAPEKGYGVEVYVCVVLREAARYALEQKAAIIFC